MRAEIIRCRDGLWYYRVRGYVMGVGFSSAGLAANFARNMGYIVER